MNDESTPRQVAETSLREILKHSPAGVAVVARSPRRRLFVNQSFLDLFGAKTEAEIKAVPIRDTWVDADEFEHYARQADQADLIRPIEVRRRRLDGEVRWVMISS